jgi:WD40 repeat protein
MFTLKGHEGPVFDLALISDSKLASASHDKTVKIWDLDKRECIKTLDYEKESYTSDRRINKVIYLKGKNHLAAGFMDGSVTIWDLKDFKRVKSFRAHSNSHEQISCIKSISDEVLATATYGKIKIWSVYEKDFFSNAKLLHKLKDKHSGWVQALEVTSNGNLLSGSFDETLVSWDMKSGKSLDTFKVNEMVYDMKLGSDNKSVAIIAGDKNILFYDLISRASVAHLKGAHDGFIFNVKQFGNKNQFLATSSADSLIKIWTI